MNDTDTTTKQFTPNKTLNKKKKIVVGVATVVLLSGVGYGVAAYSNVWWPFTLTTSSQDSSSEDAGSKKLSQSDIAFEEPSINTEATTARFFADIQTTKQGECELTLTSKKDTVTFKHSTVGIDGVTGCADWNVNYTPLSPGLYDAEISFSEGGQSISARSQIKLP